MSTKTNPEVGDLVTVFLRTGGHKKLTGEIAAIFEEGSTTLRMSERYGWREGLLIFIPASNIAYVSWGLDV